MLYFIFFYKDSGIIMLDDFGLFSDFGSKIFLNRKVFKESHVPNIEKYRTITSFLQKENLTSAKSM